MAAPIEIDVGCIHCSYNLRGLPFDGRCPECGGKVWDSVIKDERSSLDAMHFHRAKGFERLAADSGYPVDAFMLVSDVVSGALREGTTVNKPHRVNAGGVMNYFQRYCVFYFNDENEARDLLTSWKLTTSEDVGHVMFAMVDAGMMTCDLHDRPSDFNALWALDHLSGCYDSSG